MPSHFSIKSLVKRPRYLIAVITLLIALAPLSSSYALETSAPPSPEQVRSKIQGNYSSTGLSGAVRAKWKTKIGGPNHFQGTPQSNPSTPLIIGDTLYVGSSTGIFYAYSIKRGSRLWTFNASYAIHASVANERSICFGTDGGKLFCLNRADGTELFHYEITSSINSAPVMDSENIYFLSTRNRLHAISLQDGKKLWTYSQRNRVDLVPRFINTPAQSADKLFVIFSNGVLAAIEKKSGKDLWQRTLLKGPGPWPGGRKRPVYLEGNLYVIDKDGVLLALDANTGSLRVLFDVTRAVDFIVTRDTIIIASTDELLSVSRATGNVLWIEALTKSASNRIFGAGEHIYVISVTEKDPPYLAYVMKKRSVLSAYTIDDGTFLWKRKYKSSISADISVANDSLAILTDKGRLFVIGSKDE